MSCLGSFCQLRINLQCALVFCCVVVLLQSSPATADDPRNSAEFWDSISFTPMSVMQGVSTTGATTWSVPKPDGTYQAYKLRGVVLNDPAHMLDGTADHSAGPSMYMGGQWQIYVQTIDQPDTPTELVGDFGGVALWMGQNYGNHMANGFSVNDPTATEIYSYSDQEWSGELNRLNYAIDISTGVAVQDVLRPGDLIEIHARGAKYYKGKYNCNEDHKKSASYNFDIYIVERNVALPITDFTLSDVKNESDGFLFDDNTDGNNTTRQFGGEYYQGERVRLKNVTITNPQQWGIIDPASISTGTNDVGDYYTVKVADDTGRTFDVVLGYNSAFLGTSAPSGSLDIVGIFDQEGSSTGKDCYRMWALTPDDFLPSDLLPGDADMNGTVNDADAAIMAANWGKLNNALWRQGDFNRDGKINRDDAALMSQNWLMSSVTSSAVPEPGAALLLCGCGLMLLVWRKRDHKK